MRDSSLHCDKGEHGECDGPLNWQMRAVERLTAFATDCVANGDMTPTAKTMLLRILTDAQTGGLHPAELCGEDCSGCCNE